jgi:hypothetical protein
MRTEIIVLFVISAVLGFYLYTLTLGRVKLDSTEGLISYVAPIFEDITGKELVVTSAERDAFKQGQLMLRNYHMGVDLYILYKRHDLLDKIMPHIKDGNVLEIENELKRQMNVGDYISKHLCGQAIDIRSRHLTMNQRIEVVKRLNKTKEVMAINEGTHIHIQTVGECK